MAATQLPPFAPGSKQQATDPVTPVWLKFAVEAGSLCSAQRAPLPELEAGPAAPGGSEVAMPLPAPAPGLDVALSDPGIGGRCRDWRPPPGLEEGLRDPDVSKTGPLVLVQQPEEEAGRSLEQSGALSSDELVDPVSRDSDKGLPSVGIHGHDEGLCKPCLFWHKSICRMGEECSYCHMPHEDQKDKRLRPSKKTRAKWAKQGLTVHQFFAAKAAAASGYVETVACDGCAVGASIAQDASQKNGPEGKSAIVEFEPSYVGLPQWAVPLPLGLHAQALTSKP